VQPDLGEVELEGIGGTKPSKEIKIHIYVGNLDWATGSTGMGFTLL